MKTIAFAAAGILAALAGCCPSGNVEFKMHTINADSRFEGASAMDVNSDGRLDIVCGSYWYEGPSWEKHFIREIAEQGNYHYDFADLPLDVDGDGWDDIVTCAWHDKRVAWIRNPGNSGDAWEEFTIDTPGNMETLITADVNQDGQTDVVPNIFNNEPGWYEFHRVTLGGTTKVDWTKHPLPAEMIGPGVGVGDIDGDGRNDIVGHAGWVRQPADANGEWTWQAEFDLGDSSIPILVHDLDDDGDNDLIWGIGHAYGLYWLEQEPDALGRRTWCKHEIDTTWSQAHVVILGDLDGDGDDELVTGKRYFAHNGKDPGGNEQRCLYWYDFDKHSRRWTRHVIHEGGPAGTGTSTMLADIDADGDLDLLAPGKSGLYLFENLRR